MNLQGIIADFRVKPKNAASFHLKWRWKRTMSKIAYFQISHAYREMNETKTVYSHFIPGGSPSSYTINDVQANKDYQICLRVFIRNVSFTNEIIRTHHTMLNNQSQALIQGRICAISVTSTSHLQAVISCLAGVFIALLLLGLVTILCCFYKRWVRNKRLQTCPPGSNQDYYERHRNSETNTTPTEDLSGFDDCEASCTSQMIMDGLAWSPSSSLDSRFNLNIMRSKSGLQNHSSSHPSSTPRILEEDGFYEGFVEKVSDTVEGDKATSNRGPESVKAQKIISPFFSTTSCSTLNSFGCDYPQFIDNGIDAGATISNNHAILEELKQNYHSDSTKSSNNNLTLQLIDEV